MDAFRFDALARSFSRVISRRHAVIALLPGLVASFLAHDRLAVAKKKKPKKKCKVKCGGKVCGPSNCKGKSCGSCPAGSTCGATGQCVCAPRCDGKQCGADGCGGICGPGCALGAHCNAQGLCVGCTSVEQCATLFCKQAACTNETCQYSNLPDDIPCSLPPHICCGGECVDPRSDPLHCNTCDNPCAPRGNTCIGGQCWCGDNPPCPAGATCEAGQCVCPGGQVLCLDECLNGACCAVGKGCTLNDDCCNAGNTPNHTACGDGNRCCKSGGSDCDNAGECCSGVCTPLGHVCA